MCVTCCRTDAATASDIGCFGRDLLTALRVTKRGSTLLREVPEEARVYASAISYLAKRSAFFALR